MLKHGLESSVIPPFVSLHCESKEHLVLSPLRKKVSSTKDSTIYNRVINYRSQELIIPKKIRIR